MAKPPVELSSQKLFKELLKQKRRAMKPHIRERSKHPKITKQWLYPYQYERLYAKKISEIQNEFIEVFTSKIELHLKRWLAEYRGDSTEVILHNDQFSTELTKLVEDINKQLQQKYGPDAPSIRTLITAAGGDVSSWNYEQAQKFYKDLLGVEFVFTEPWEKEVISNWSDNNFTLIKSLSSEYIKVANDIVSDGVAFGKTFEEIMKELRAKNKQISGSRARLIARDQIGKLNAQLTKRRMGDAGISMYTWSTAGDERVRGNPSGPFKNSVPSHYVMNGLLCRWDDNSVYSEDGGKTWKNRSGKMSFSIPGQEIQCRCTALPFFDDMIEEVDENIQGDLL